MFEMCNHSCVVLARKNAHGGLSAVVEVALPIIFGCVQAMINLWITYDPLMYLMRGTPPRLSLRWLEVGVLVGMGLATYAVIGSDA